MSIKKRSIKSLICFSLVLAILLQFSLALNVQAAENNGNKNQISKNITDKIPKDATQFVLQNYKDVIDVVKEHINQFNIEADSLNDIRLGKPYIIYNLDNEKQDEIYYYPVLKGDTVVLVINVMGTTDGWTLSASEDMTSELSNINYSTEDYLFYQSDNNIIAENTSKSEKMTGKDNQACRDFEAIDYSKKIELVSKRMDNLIKTDAPQIDSNVEHLEKGNLTLSNPQGQGSYGMCWAASVATIVNFVFASTNSNVTAKDVCAKEGIGWNDGATIQQKRQALYDYKIWYNSLAYRQCTWSEVTTAITNHTPIAVSSATSDSSSWHAVTVYGYSMPSTTSYITLWNSGINNGAGGTQVVEYSSTGSHFAYNNTTYYWVYSLWNVI